VCAALPDSIGNLQNLTTLKASYNQIKSKFLPLCSTRTTFGLSVISVCVFADAEKQRVRAALPGCKNMHL
jgi:hypothetical protein